MNAPMVTMDSTADLIRRAQKGDRQAFEALVERFRSRLETQVRSRMSAGVRAKLEPEDVLNETLARAFESMARSTWTGEEAFYRWLAGIAEHLIRNAARKRGWRPLEVARDPAAPGPTPSSGLRREERFERLQKALDGLSPDHKRALVLARLEGLPVKEIAARMERSTGAVKKLLARALAELKRRFGDTESFHLPDRALETEEDAGPENDDERD
jgi:RNA polymerase sigma-70 factor (ECF subfamily)